MNIVKQLNKVTLLNKNQVKNVEKSLNYLTKNSTYFNIHDILSNCGHGITYQDLTINEKQKTFDLSSVKTLDKIFNKKLKKIYDKNRDFQSLFYLQNKSYSETEDRISKFLHKEDQFLPLELILMKNGIKVTNNGKIKKPKNIKDIENSMLKLEDFGITQDQIIYRYNIWESDFKEMRKNKIVAIDAEYMGYLANKEFSELCCSIQIATPKNVFIYPLYHLTKYQKTRFYKLFRQ